ncbi:hypothetical protein HNV12_08510 [Methanococcoides sp. SA1]|nr:hypothetical protein [Methanococcoides sp. SA1]
MPFTPFHLGPAFLLGMVFKKKIDIIAVLLASVIIDVRAAIYLFLGHEPLHGPFHTFIGATVLALLLGYVLIYISHRLGKNLEMKPIILGSLIGAWSHVFLDSFLYTDIIPFWPLMSNPLLGAIGSTDIYGLCVLSGVAGLGIIAFNYMFCNQKLFK